MGLGRGLGQSGRARPAQEDRATSPLTSVRTRKVAEHAALAAFPDALFAFASRAQNVRSVSPYG
eukprot:5527540-Pleurochrysis_carterae.AAC.1